MNKTAAPDERKHLRSLRWKKWVGLCSPTMCVYTVLVTAPANEHLHSQEQAEVQSGRETACTNYLCKSTFLKASFL